MVSDRSALQHVSIKEREALREFVRRLLGQFDNLIEAVVLFGSKARGESEPESDIDVLVVVGSEDWRVHRKIRYVAADIWLDYLECKVNLSTRVWSSKHYDTVRELNTLLYQNIHRDGIDLLEAFDPERPERADATP